MLGHLPARPVSAQQGHFARQEVRHRPRASSATLVISARVILPPPRIAQPWRVIFVLRGAAWPLARRVRRGIPALGAWHSQYHAPARRAYGPQVGWRPVVARHARLAILALGRVANLNRAHALGAVSQQAVLRAIVGHVLLAFCAMVVRLNHPRARARVVIMQLAARHALAQVALLSQLVTCAAAVLPSQWRVRARSVHHHWVARAAPVRPVLLDPIVLVLFGNHRCARVRPAIIARRTVAAQRAFRARRARFA